jgi:TolA-binding protein
MRALVLALALCASGLQDKAEEQYAYVAGLAEKGLSEQVVREAQGFLREHAAHPKADVVRYRLGCALFELQREKEAAPVFRELARRPDFELAAEVQFRLGQCLLAGGEREAAEQALARVLAAKKEYLVPPALALLAQSELARKDHEHALAHFEQLLARKDAGDYAADARCSRAWCLQRLGRAAEAAQAARGALPSAPQSRQGEMSFLLGECLLDAHDARGALEAYGSVREGPYADAALRGSGFARVELGDQNGAANDFGALLERFPQSPLRGECALQRGVALLRAGDARAALAAFASPDCPGDAEALSWRARAEEAAGDKQAALSSVERALATRPGGETEQRLALQRADLLAGLGRSGEAQRIWEGVGNDRALLAAAVAALADKRHAEAARLAAALLERFPQSPLRADALLARAEGCFGAQQWHEAEQAFATAAQEDKDAARALKARSRAAWCAYEAGEFPRAALAFDALAAAKSDAPEIEEAAFMAARAREDAGDASASEVYDRFLARFPSGAHRDEAELRCALLCGPEAGRARLEKLLGRLGQGALAARARFELAERLSQTGHAAEALPHYRQALADPALAEHAPRASYGLAWCLYQEKQHSEAAAELERLLARERLDPKLQQAALELAVWSTLQGGDLERALRGWNALTQSGFDEERCAPLLHALSAALVKAQRSEDAGKVVAAFDRGARSPRGHAKAGVERALLLASANQPAEARREIEKLRAQGIQDPALSEALFRLGENCYAQGDDAQAIPLYDAAASEAAAPIADRALYKAGFARMRSSDAAGAERCFQKLVDEHPQSELLHESLFLLGEAQFRQQRYEAAAKNLERVRREAPRHAVLPKALFRLGLALGELQRWKESAEVLGALVRSNPDFPNLAEAELGRGRALAESGDARAARAALERVLALDKGLLSAQAHLELGRLCYGAADLDGALSEFLKVAVLYDSDEEVAEALFLAGRVLEDQKQPDKALGQYREVLEKHPKARYVAEAQKRVAELGRR